MSASSRTRQSVTHWSVLLIALLGALSPGLVPQPVQAAIEQGTGVPAEREIVDQAHAPPGVHELLSVTDALSTGTDALPSELPSAPQVEPADRARVEKAFGRLPVYFEENQGQVDEQVAYMIQGADKTIYFTPDGVTFALTASLAETANADTPDVRDAALLPRTADNPMMDEGVPKLGAYFLYLDETAPGVVSLVGNVPAIGTVRYDLARPAPGGLCTYNFISVSLDRDDLLDADGLAADIGGVYSVSRWNATTQDMTCWQPGTATGDNFPVRAGHPYILCLEETGPASWP